MEEIKIESQPCTTERQSYGLLALGLKKETADMCYITTGHGKMVSGCSYICEAKYESKTPDLKFMPAWSLHRLMAMCPGTVFQEEVGTTLCLSISHRVVFYEDADNKYTECFNSHDDLYSNLIDCISWLVRKDFFNKDYLDETKMTS